MKFYFVHPQIRLSNIAKAKLSLVKRPNLEKIKEKLSFYFPNKQFIFTDMGRSAFKVIIEKLNLQNTEMLLPAYICDIFYPILRSYKIKPVFLDIDLKTFHIKTDEIAKKITPKTKTLLICHTYGLPFDVSKLQTISISNNSNVLNNSNIAIIEDCAHAFFSKKNGVYTGNQGTASFFSLYKQFPTLRGGMVVCPKDWKVDLLKTGFNFRDFISFLNCFSPFAFFFKKFGQKVAPKMLRKEKMEKPAEINNASLSLFCEFFGETEEVLENRKKAGMLFREELKEIGFEVQEAADSVFCYLAAMVPQNLIDKRDDIVENLRKYGVFCTRIWHTPIILNKEVQKEYQINLAEFPNTVEAAKRIINFPLQNHYTEKDVRRMIKALKKVLQKI